jgi:hypothetical protein
MVDLPSFRALCLWWLRVVEWIDRIVPLEDEVKEKPAAV